jgi:hypothetical protein
LNGRYRNYPRKWLDGKRAERPQNTLSQEIRRRHALLELSEREDGNKPAVSCSFRFVTRYRSARLTFLPAYLLALRIASNLV